MYEERSATIAEMDRFDASIWGSEKPDSEWILSDRDVWYSNPYYTGTPTGTHPEDEAPPDEFESLGIALYLVGQEACQVKGCLEEAKLDEDDLPF